MASPYVSFSIAERNFYIKPLLIGEVAAHADGEVAHNACLTKSKHHYKHYVFSGALCFLR